MRTYDSNKSARINLVLMLALMAGVVMPGGLCAPMDAHAATYYLRGDTTTDLGFDGIATLPNVQSTGNAIPYLGSMLTTAATGSNWRPSSIPAGTATLIDGYTAIYSANAVDISGISSSCAMRSTATDTISFYLYDYNPDTGVKTLMATSATGTAGQTTVAVVPKSWTLSNARVQQNNRIVFRIAKTSGAARTTDRLYYQAATATTGCWVTFTETPAISEFIPPSSSITAPANGSTYTLASASPATISGTAVDDASGSGIASIQVSIDNGATWNDASCSNCPTTGSTTANWTYSWTLPSENIVGHTLKSRATDRASNGETPGAGISVTVDRVRPAVSSTAPVNGATGVPMNSAVTIVWSENVNCANVTTATVAITPAVAWSRTACSGNQAIFTPAGQSANTQYTITAGTGVTDAAGNAMASATAFSYTTSAVASLAQPANITLSGMKTAGPDVSWDSVPGAAQYNIYRSTDGSTWGSAIGSVVDPATSYTDTTAPLSNTTYYWTVTAQNADGESDKTDSVTGRTALLVGFNMVSAPCNASGSTASVFGSWANWSWTWDSTGNTDPDNNGVWNKAGIAPGESTYTWAYNDSTVLTASGAANAVSLNVTLVPGWNLIANHLAAPLTDIGANWLVDGASLSSAVTANIIAGSLSWWNGSTYDTLVISANPVIEPWKGYFILNMDVVNHTLTLQ